MNKVYRIVWNCSHGGWEVVSELAGRRRSAGSRLLAVAVIGGSLLASVDASAMDASPPRDPHVADLGDLLAKYAAPVARPAVDIAAASARVVSTSAMHGPVESAMAVAPARTPTARTLQGNAQVAPGHPAKRLALTPSLAHEDDRKDDDNADTVAAVASQASLPASYANGNGMTTMASMAPVEAMTMRASAAPVHAAIGPGDPRYPLPAEPTVAGLIVGTGGVLGNVGGALNPTLNSLLDPNSAYQTSGSLKLATANITQTYQSLGIGSLGLVNLTPLGVAVNGTLMGQNQHLTLLGGVTSDSYITNVNRGTDGFFAGALGLLLPQGSPAWASDCASLLGITLAHCWAVNPAQDNQVIIGDKATANGSQEVVIGRGASHTLPAESADTVFPGDGRNDPNNPSGVPTSDFADRKGNSVVIGDSASGTANAQTILGANATSDQVNSVALGNGSNADRAAQASYAAFGLTATQKSAGAVAIGSAGNERQLIHVAAGSDSFDAVNVLQLQGALNQIAAVGDVAVKYDVDAGGLPTDSVTLSGTGTAPVGIHNLAAGAVTAGSADAVNGAQLFATNSAVASYFGGTTSFDPVTGIFTAPSFAITSVAVDGTTSLGHYNNVTDAFDAVDGSMNNVNTRISNIENGSASKYFQVNSTGAVAQASGTDATAIGPAANASVAGAVALGAGSVADRAGSGNEAFTGIAVPAQGVVSVGSTGAERQITNVAGGTEDTDAVNLRQLRAVDGRVSNLDALAVRYDDMTHATISLNSGGAPTSLTNVAAGTEGAASVDAVNGSQVWHWTQDSSNAYSNISLYNRINAIQAPNGPAATGFAVNDSKGLGGPVVSGDNSAAGGAGAVASGAGSTALGNGAQATADNAVALGAGSVADRAGTVSVGAAGAERQIANVAAGTAATDAVNLTQLQASQQGTVRYDSNTDGSTNYGGVTLGGPGGTAGPTVIHNVGAGTASTDAANIGQLNQVADWSRDYTDSRVNAFSRDLDNVNNRASAGVASAMAMAGLPQAYLPGRNMASMAASTFRGESSLAIGVSTISEGGGWVYRLSGTTNTRGDAGVSLGAGMQW